MTNPKFQISSKFQVPMTTPHPIPLPSGERGRVRTLVVSNLVLWNLFVIWPACAKPLRRRQVLGIWCFVPQGMRKFLLPIWEQTKFI